MGIKLLVVGGGGGGGSSTVSPAYGGGGGGGGGFRYIPNHSVVETTYTVTVGAGGTSNNNGGSSSFGSISVDGGGAGGNAVTSGSADPGSNGACGGGGGSDGVGAGASGGTSTGYGYGGGGGYDGHGGGGGGAAGTGGVAKVPADGGGLNGAGAPCDITGSIVYYAGGGSGGYGSNYTSVGGGGIGSQGVWPTPGHNGIDGLGGGGGGSFSNYDNSLGGTGGSGTVIVAYLTKVYNCSYTGSNVETFVSGDYTVVKFNASGSFTVNSYARWQTPISRWELDNNALDLYGLYNGTAVDMTYSTDTKSKGLSGSFSSSPVGYVNLSGLSLSSYDNFTMSIWVKCTSSGEMYLIHERVNSPDYRTAIVIRAGNLIRILTYVNSTFYLVDSGVTIDRYVWNHIVVTFSGSATASVSVYLNGKIYNTGSLTRYPSYQAPTFYLGAYGPSTTSKLVGFLDDVRFYDVALTADEVMNLYKSYAIPIWQQPLHRWKLDGDATDSAGSRNGTATDVTYSKYPKITGDYSGYFNGSSSNINMGDWSWASYTNFTVSAWFKVPGVSTAILTCTRAGYKFPRLQLILGSVGEFAGVLKYAVVDDAGSVLLDIGAPKASNDDIWHHIILIDANGTVTGYLDGFISFTGSYTRENLSNLTRVTMGALINEIIDRPLFGLLDDVRFYDVALSAADVRALYNSYFTEKATNFMSML